MTRYPVYLETAGDGRESLSAQRSHLLARLATERAGLLEQLIGLDEETLTQRPVFDDWTAKDLLAHVAGWDEVFTERVERILAGREAEIIGVDVDARNAALHAERRYWPLEQALVAVVKARADALATLVRLSDEELHRSRTFTWGEASVRLWTQWRADHDATHAADLATWRQAQHLQGKTGPKAILLAGLTAGREALLAAAALVPVAERETRAVCGGWTLKDVLGHVADWEWLCVDAVRQMAAGHPPQVDYDGDLEAWNQAHVEARRDQPWEAVGADCHAARKALLEVLEGMSQADLSRRIPSRWSPEDTPYRWAQACLAHDREHVEGLRSQEVKP
jgi:hypothetical protein